MCQSCRCAKYKWTIILFTQIKCNLHKFFCLRTVGRFQYRKLCSSCDHSCILLILRAVKSRIICYDNDKSSIDSHIRYGISRICCHVKSYMFHTGHSPDTCDRCANRNFCCDLLIRRPFTVKIVFVFDQILADLSTRCSGICGRYFHACLICSSGNRLITEHNHFFYF